MSAIYDIQKIEPEELTKVNDFLLKNFFTREPLGLRLGIKPETDVSEWLSQVTQPLLDQQVLFLWKLPLLYLQGEPKRIFPQWLSIRIEFFLHFSRIGLTLINFFPPNLYWKGLICCNDKLQCVSNKKTLIFLLKKYPLHGYFQAPGGGERG